MAAILVTQNKTLRILFLIQILSFVSENHHACFLVMIVEFLYQSENLHFVDTLLFLSKNLSSLK